MDPQAVSSVTQIDPMLWANAVVRVGWPVPVLAAWYIFWRWGPWGRKEKS